MSTISPPIVPSVEPILGSQAPRISHVPEYVSSAGQETVELCALAGLHLDPWEITVLVGGLGERADGKWAAFEVGIDVPRQNGKGSILEARELAGLFLFGEKLLIHSAHEQATSSEHFRRLLSLIEGVPEFERRVLKAPKGKGAEAIELRGGQRIFFKTRTGGGGRGLTGDFVALDEAMILPVATTAALVPTMAARSIHGNPQLWYAGSAVDKVKHEHGIVFARVRERGMKQAPRVAWFEWSAPGDDPSQVPEQIRTDPAMWAQANPGMGIRISAEHIANEAGGALGPREFAVERLGIGDWPATDDMDGRVFQPGVWSALRDPASKPLDPVCFSIDTRPDRGMTAIGAAGFRADGQRHVEIVQHSHGTDWVAERAVALVAAHKCVGLMIDGAGPAASLIPDLERLGLNVIAKDKPGVGVRVLTSKDQAQACGMFYDAVDQSILRHLGTDELGSAVDGAVRRPLGDAWAWSRKDSSADISPLVAATLALWGSGTHRPVGKPAVINLAEV